jgi:hypothetical protein
MEITTALFAIVLAGAIVVGIVLAFLGLRLITARTARQTVEVRSIAERVRAVGRLVGLEVFAKEIATAKSGWPWCPPVLLSQAKLAMIFHFEKQYGVDLGSVKVSSIERLGEEHYRVRLPEIVGTLRLVDVTPYDIQQGRVLGLLDVIPMNAERQALLMRAAQEQASALYEHGEDRYLAQAREAIERQLTALLGLFGVRVEWEWPEEDGALARLDGAREERPRGVPMLALAGAG